MLVVLSGAHGGVGFRYRVARMVGLDGGADLAHGPQASIFHLLFGRAWLLGMD